MRPRLSALLVALLALCVLAPVAHAGERGAARELQRLRHDTPALSAFLRAMPKGTDLHTHLSGAVYAEAMVRYGAADGICVDPLTLTSSYPPCTMTQQPLSDALPDNVLYNRIIAAWSMRGFTPGAESGHDHFFATFDKFGAALGAHKGDGLAEVAQRAAVQNEQYIEPLITPQFGAVSTVAKKVGYDPDLAALRTKLLDAGLLDAIPAASKDIDSTLAQERTALGCDTSHPKRACGLRVGFDVQVLRNMPPAVVFAQLLFGFALQGQDARWVGLNMVQPEDAPISLSDYRLHMRMVGYLRTLYPKAHVTLHAGELAPGVAPPADLRFHIHDAVEVAHAQRIGHGVDLRWERNPGQTLRYMRAHHVCVEINLSSNRQILGVAGKAHPLDTYVKAGVPVTLSTDDEGVERTDLTAQYVQAVQDHGLGYRRLKTIARTGLQCSFLPAAQKAAALRDQARRFTAFERRWR
jgi:adenosine deaminase